MRGVLSLALDGLVLLGIVVSVAVSIGGSVRGLPLSLKRGVASIEGLDAEITRSIATRKRVDP